jgi:hypothetical protein
MRVALTPRLVETLKVEPGRSRSIYLDTHRDAPKGFALRVTEKGGRAFYLLRSSKEHGRLWVHIGDASEIGLEKARARGEEGSGDPRRQEPRRGHEGRSRAGESSEARGRGCGG